MKNENLYVDIHVLQTIPPSCVNRDDTGSPKTAVYGGTTRARVSSQAWKRAMRLMFKENIFSSEQIGERTKDIPRRLKEEILKLEPECKTVDKLAKAALVNAGIKVNDKEDKLDVLFFISNTQLSHLAKLALQKENDKKEYQNALKKMPSVDIALFGRMVASDPLLNCDAAAQVAHAISTHTVHNEYDYFTAVDDCSPEDNVGAGHIGTIEYNSSTLYRYATVNVNELKRQIPEETVSVVRGFVETFIKSMPDGKQNTFANRTLPDLVYVTIRNDQPVNLCGAFEKPVKSKDGGFVEPSEERLIDYAQMVYSTFTDKPVKGLGVGQCVGFDKIADIMPLNQMLDALEQAIADTL